MNRYVEGLEISDNPKMKSKNAYRITIINY